MVLLVKDNVDIYLRVTFKYMEQVWNLYSGLVNHIVLYTSVGITAVSLKVDPSGGKPGLG